MLIVKLLVVSQRTAEQYAAPALFHGYTGISSQDVMSKVAYCIMNELSSFHEALYSWAFILKLMKSFIHTPPK